MEQSRLLPLADHWRRRKSRISARRNQVLTEQTVQIQSLGAKGDGIATTSRGPLYVPFTLPGETVLVEIERDRGQLTGLETTSDQRVAPVCRHFGPQGANCGGCKLQHMDSTAYRAWKHQLVVDALASQNIDCEVGSTIECHPGSRRRAVFAARKTQKGVLFGFHQAQTHRIVSISECPVLEPAIESKIDDLRQLSALLAAGTKPFRLTVLATESGLDVTAHSVRLNEKLRRNAIALALKSDLARLAIEDEVLIEARKPLLTISGARLHPPPGAFVQASATAQSTMTGMVLDHLSGLKRTADLFAGCGAFALSMARHASVLAAESEGPSLDALDQAARHTQGLRPVTAERRDLFRRPLRPEELKPIGGVVFDPPRAGAQAQATELARSGVQKIVAVSCNPVTLARDLRILIDGGFQLKSVTPIDQFLWSPHVEAVALLER